MIIIMQKRDLPYNKLEAEKTATIINYFGFCGFCVYYRIIRDFFCCCFLLKIKMGIIALIVFNFFALLYTPFYLRVFVFVGLSLHLFLFVLVLVLLIS